MSCVQARYKVVPKMLKHRKANNKINQNNRTRTIGNAEVDARAYVLPQC